jgi:hypothetical protein
MGNQSKSCLNIPEPWIVDALTNKVTVFTLIEE